MANSYWNRFGFCKLVVPKIERVTPNRPEGKNRSKNRNKNKKSTLKLKGKFTPKTLKRESQIYLIGIQKLPFHRHFQKKCLLFCYIHRPRRHCQPNQQYCCDFKSNKFSRVDLSQSIHTSFRWCRRKIKRIN